MKAALFVQEHQHILNRDRAVRGVLALCGWFTLLSIPASAAEFTSISVGYEGCGQVGEWLPVKAQAAGLEPGSDARLVIRSFDARGNSTIEVCNKGAIDGEGRISLDGAVRPGRLDTLITVQLTGVDTLDVLCQWSLTCGTQSSADISTIQSYLRMFRRDVGFWLTVGEQTPVTEFLREINSETAGNSRMVGLQLDSDNQFPKTSRVLGQFSAIIIHDTIELSEKQFSALKMWTRAGGRLIVSSDDGVETLDATGFGQWLNQYFQIAPVLRRVAAADLRAIQQRLRGATNILLVRDYSDLQMAEIQAGEIEVLATSPLSPSVARVRAGKGSITYVAVNFQHPVLSRWQSLPEFYGALLTDSEDRVAGDIRRNARISHSGISDLSTQLMATVDPSPQVHSWSTWNVIGLAGLWLILIGPVDYLLVVRLLKRPEWTWCTFPAWVVLAVIAVYSLKPPDTALVTANALHLMDVTTAGEQQILDIRSFGSISANSPSFINLTVVPNAELAPANSAAALHWSGRAEDVYGGMYRSRGIGSSDNAYLRDASDPMTLRSVPMVVDGSFEFEAGYSGEFARPAFESSVKVKGVGLLSGSLSHHFPSPVSDWIVVYGNRVYRPRGPVHQSWNADTEWKFERGSAQITDLKSWLTGERRRQGAAPGKDTSLFGTTIRYDSNSRDSLDIVTMISLYRAAGATTYCGLSNDYFNHMDVSSVISNSQAILIGTLGTDASRMMLDDEVLQPAQSTCVLRVMIPVTQVTENQDEKHRPLLQPPQSSGQGAEESRNSI